MSLSNHMTEEQIQTLIQYQKDILAENEIARLASPVYTPAVHIKLWELSDKFFEYTAKEFPDPRTLDPERAKNIRNTVLQFFEGEKLTPDTMDETVLRAMEPEVAVIAVAKYLVNHKVRWTYTGEVPGLTEFGLRNHSIMF